VRQREHRGNRSDRELLRLDCDTSSRSPKFQFQWPGGVMVPLPWGRPGGCLGGVSTDDLAHPYIRLLYCILDCLAQFHMLRYRGCSRTEPRVSPVRALKAVQLKPPAFTDSVWLGWSEQNKAPYSCATEPMQFP
jgi:hypothetical protein